jgi:protein TonB
LHVSLNVGENERTRIKTRMTTQQAQARQPARRPSHLTVRPEGEGADVRALFDANESSVGRARVLSGTVVHVIAVVLLVVVVRFLPEKVYETILPERISQDIVWLSDPGPGGGGGGGNKSPDPPKAAELKGEQKITVPAVKPPEPTPQEKPEPPPPLVEPQLTLPAQQMAAATSIEPGLIGPPSTTPSDSRGSGRGTGVGPGTGSGLGPGSGGGTGGGVFQPGSGVVTPIPIKEIKPQYTADAMRAKVQGIVVVQCVVLPDGTVGAVEVVKSLDPTFGLDQEAVKAAKQWRFKPGTRFGEPVAVLVSIELTFTLR